LAETCGNARDIADYLDLVGNHRQRIRFYRGAEHRYPERYLSGRRYYLDSAYATTDDLDGDGIVPRTTSSLKA
jgi:hypothetical protein